MRGFFAHLLCFFFLHYPLAVRVIFQTILFLILFLTTIYLSFAYECV